MHSWVNPIKFFLKYGLVLEKNNQLQTRNTKKIFWRKVNNILVNFYKNIHLFQKWTVN